MQISGISQNFQSFSKWQTNLTSNTKPEIKSDKPMTEQQMQLQQLKESYSRQKSSEAIQSLHSKIMKGEKLTPEEKDYLKANSPDLYESYEQVEKEREALKEKLEKAKSKKEVQEIYNGELQKFSAEVKSITQSNMPKGEKDKAMMELGARFSGIVKEYSEFVDSENYAKLPNDEDDDTIKIKLKDEEKLEIKKKDDDNKEDIDVSNKEEIHSSAYNIEPEPLYSNEMKNIQSYVNSANIDISFSFQNIQV